MTCPTIQYPSFFYLRTKAPVMCVIDLTPSVVDLNKSRRRDRPRIEETHRVLPNGSNHPKGNEKNPLSTPLPLNNTTDPITV